MLFQGLNPEVLRGQQERDAARWFISLRWIAVVVAILLAAVAVHVLEFLPPESWPRLAAVIAALATLNVIYTIHLRSDGSSFSSLAAQGYADLVLLTLLIHFSGGIENPLVLLMLFHVVIAGITLSRVQCYVVAGFATLLVALLAAAEASGVVDHYTLRLVPHYEEHGELAHAAYDTLYAASFVGLQGIVLFLTAYFVTALAERLRQKEGQLALSAERDRTQRQLLARSLETTETGLLVCDRDLRPVLSNRRWNAWRTRFEGDPALNETLFGERSLIHQTLESGVIRVSEATACAPMDTDDTPATFQATTAPLVDEEGRITHVVQLVRDITLQKRAERRMIRAGQLAAVGELAGQVAHEVNNPIAIISAKARILLSDHGETLSNRTVAELVKIVDLADRVGRIATGLLSYARPSGAHRTRSDVSRSARKALSMIEQRARNAGIVLEDRLPATLPPVVVNEDEVEQIFLNLLLNGLEAMPSGGRLAVSSAVDDGGLTVSVIDDGVGIPKELLHRIFEPFFTTRVEGKGTGLGLSICRGLVEHNGGRIEVESAPGEGTTARVSFFEFGEEE